MSIRDKKIIFDAPKVKRGFAFFALIGIIELIFSFFLMLSLAGRIFAPQASEAAPSPQLISFQGRLTDTLGNPLGGTGTPYCFRYTVWDAPSSGNKLWPAGTASSTSIATVVDGVFSDQIGRTDPLSYDFSSTSTLFLQLDVNTVTSTCAGSWESLSPRQQLTSAPYAQVSTGLYGNALRATTSTKVQVGTGAGSPTSSMTLFSLDVANVSESIGGTCSNPGTMWYNSTLSRALVCESGLIQGLSNSSTTIAGIGTNTSSSITAGNVVFSNSNGVSFGQSGSTITASVAAAGAGAVVTYLTYQNRQLGASTTIAPGQNSVWMVPFRVPGNVAISGSTIQLIEAYSGTATSAVAATYGQTIRWGLYSNNTTNSTRLDTWATGSFTLQVWNSGTTSASYAYNGNTSSSAATGILTQVYGTRMHNIPLNSSIPSGLYVMAFALSTSSAGYSALVSRSHIIMDAPMPLGMGMNFGSATATSIGYVDAGTYSATSGVMPSSIGLSEIRQISNYVPYFKIGAL